MIPSLASLSLTPTGVRDGKQPAKAVPSPVRLLGIDSSDEDMRDSEEEHESEGESESEREMFAMLEASVMEEINSEDESDLDEEMVAVSNSHGASAPVRLLGFDYWVHVLEQLDPEVSACRDVDRMCQTLRKTGKELGQQTPCDDAHFWERMCQIRAFVFHSPEYVPIASTSELDRWRKQYLLFCRVATSTNRGNLHVNALRALGSTPTVPKRAFYSCTSLELTHLPEGLTTIGLAAFSGCSPQVQALEDAWRAEH